MLHRPLPWLLAAEAVVLVALGVAGWHLVADRLSPPPSPSLAALPPPTAARATPARPSPPASPTSPPRPATARSTAPVAPPGLSTDPAFWRRYLTQLNRDQAGWEAIEARAVQAVEDFTRAYLKEVVVPAVEAASRPPPKAPSA